MILTCPNCASRFLLSAQVLAPDGRRVRCSSCSEEWFQEPDSDELIDNVENEIEEIPESVKPIPEGSSVPALHEEVEQSGNKRANLTGYMGALILFFGIFGGLAVSKEAIFKAWPPSAALYEMVGMNVNVPGEGLVFDKVKATLGADGQIIVEGIVVNLTSDIISLPAIEASVRNEAGEEIDIGVNKPPFDEMNPETSLPFKFIHNGKLGKADHVQLRFVLGNKTEEAEGIEEDPPHKDSKSASKDVDSNQAPHADDHAEPHGGVAH